MMTPAVAVLMARYNQWMNQRTYEVAAALPAEALTRDRGAFFGSILGTLNHVAVADTVWLRRFADGTGDPVLLKAMAGRPRPVALRESLAPDLAGLWRYREALDAEIVRWAQGLTEARLATTLHYRNIAGQPAARNLGLLVQHFFNHQTHHRGQVSTLLFQAGHDVGVTDLLALIPEEG
jgi:uncharacterized damage-inducible protein DinB